MTTSILKIDKAGQPLRWVTREHAVQLLCNNKVLWSFGDEVVSMYGGINRKGVQSVIHLAPIIAVDGSVTRHGAHIPLVNKYLFRRDHHRCMYCGQQFGREVLTRDHVIPQSRGGKNVWANLVSACRPCNQRKADRTPEEAGMMLKAIPFKPTFAEFLYLQNRNILGDQMSYLEKGFKQIQIVGTE